MTTATKYWTRIVLATGLGVALLFASLLLAPSGDAAGSKTETLRLFQKTKSIQLTRADGQVLKKRPLPDPRAGDVLDLTFDLFRGSHVKHAKKVRGTNHLRCTFTAAGPPSCISHAAFGSSMLVLEGNPGKVVLGTGKFEGATGRVVSSKEVEHAPESSLAHNDIDVVARIKLR